MSCRRPIRTIRGPAIPLGLNNVDTETMLPTAYLKALTRTGLGRGLFSTLRFDSEGKERTDTALNDPRYKNAPILIAGDNFGCGPSREHATWALVDKGIRVVIASSFSEMFSGNAFRNGILPVVLPQQSVHDLLSIAHAGDFSIDLPQQRVASPAGEILYFDIDPYRKRCLVDGLDEINLTEQSLGDIHSFERRHAAAHPWIDNKP